MGFELSDCHCDTRSGRDRQGFPGWNEVCSCRRWMRLPVSTLDNMSSNQGTKRRRSSPAATTPRRSRSSLFALSPPLQVTVSEPPPPLESAPAAAATAPDAKKLNFLQRLSEACKGHQAKDHVGSKATTEKDIPSNCQDEMEAVRRLLPKMHKVFRPSATTTSAMIQELCAFYVQGLHGRFCPFAPSVLFDRGDAQVGTLVLRGRFCSRMTFVSSLLSSLSTCCLFVSALYFSSDGSSAGKAGGRNHSTSFAHR
jgi:hypothetical protein